jgi:hypothetical protein
MDHIFGLACTVLFILLSTSVFFGEAKSLSLFISPSFEIVSRLVSPGSKSLCGDPGLPAEGRGGRLAAGWWARLAVSGLHNRSGFGLSSSSESVTYKITYV